MKQNLKYLIDKNGKRIAVLIPINEWNVIYKEYKSLIDFKRMKIDLSEAINEIVLFEKGKKKHRTLEQFLDEF